MIYTIHRMTIIRKQPFKKWVFNINHVTRNLAAYCKAQRKRYNANFILLTYDEDTLWKNKKK